MNKTILFMGTLMGFLAIAFGAFGAHGLEKIVEPKAVDTFETGVRYQMYHALFLLFVGIYDGLERKQKRIILVMVLLGILMFSFSIYLLALNSVMDFDFRRIGFITPVGGTFLLAAWAAFGFFLLKKKMDQKV